MSLKSFGSLSGTVEKGGIDLTALLSRMNQVDLTNEEFKEIAKALIATTTREKRRSEIEAAIRDELDTCNVDDPDCIATKEVVMTPSQ